MPYSCMIKNCDLQNKHLKNRGSYHLPKDQKVKEYWLSIIPRDSYNAITPNSRMCGLHFEKKFIRTHSKIGEKLIRSRLSAKAIPTLCFSFEKPSTNLRKEFSPSVSINHKEKTDTEHIENVSIKNEMICRGCLCDEVESLKSFLDEPTLLDMFVSCTFLQVEIGDGLPMSLCLACISKCTDWYSFKQLCEQNESQLRETLTSNSTVSIKVLDTTPNINGKTILVIDSPLKTPILTKPNDNFNNSEKMIVKNEHLFEEFNIKNENIDIQAVTNVNLNPEVLSNPLTEVTVITNKEKPKATFPCNKCSKSFKKLKSLRNHKNVNHMEFESDVNTAAFIERPFTCDSCNKNFKSKDLLRSHIYFMHFGKRFTCLLCPKKFRRKSELVIHSSNHSGERPFECKLCNKKFSCKSYLDGHMRYHSVKPNYLCAICGKSFIKCSNYKEHLLKHTGERPFPCTICNKTFISKALLTRHSQSHTKLHTKSDQLKSQIQKDEKTFTCNICEQWFFTRKELSLHLRTHDDVRVFPCTSCDKVFKQNCDLIIHLRRHTGERPFSCDLCTESFGSQKMLKIHKKKKHLLA